MKKNIASQKIGCQMCSATDGSAFTGTVTVYVTVDAGTQGLGATASGVCTHEGNGYHTYAPSQGETNGDLVAFTFIGTGAIPATIQIYTRPTTGLLAPATADRTLVVDAAGLADANVVKIGPTGSGTAQTARDLGTSVLLSSGTGTGQLSLSSGAVLLQATQTGVTIPTVTNLTNAPGAGDFTATMKTSIGTAVAASAVASVTGAVGSIGAGGITASSIASDAITAAKIADGAIDAATFAAGAINAAAIASDAITDAKVASDVTIASVTGAVGSVASGGISSASFASGAITAAAIAADAIGASELAADAVSEIAAAISVPSAATVAAAVWDLATSGHTTSGTFGEQVKTDIDDILTDTGTTLDGRIPAALVSGRIDASVGVHQTAAKAEINAEVVDALATDTYAEPGQGTPSATLSLSAKIGYLFKAWRNRSTQTSTDYKLYNDDTTTVDQKATTSDDATTFDRNEITSGP